VVQDTDYLRVSKEMADLRMEKGESVVTYWTRGQEIRGRCEDSGVEVGTKPFCSTILNGLPGSWSSFVQIENKGLDTLTEEALLRSLQGRRLGGRGAKRRGTQGMHWAPLVTTRIPTAMAALGGAGTRGMAVEEAGAAGVAAAAREAEENRGLGASRPRSSAGTEPGGSWDQHPGSTARGATRRTTSGATATPDPAPTPYPDTYSDC